jgi:hypothetical protein
MSNITMSLKQFYDIYNTNNKCFSYFIYSIIFILYLVTVSIIIVIVVPGFENSVVQLFFINLFKIIYLCVFLLLVFLFIIMKIVNSMYNSVLTINTQSSIEYDII